jgi:UDP-N-acetylglucosamine acyltransferase
MYHPDYKNRFHHTNRIHPTAIIYDCVELGENNIIGPYTVIGSNGEVRGVKEFFGKVVIGSGNVISEHVTIQRPVAAESATKIGDNNLIMAHAHIGHDAEIGDNTEICTSSIIGGFSKVGNNSSIKLGCVLRNRKKVGENCLIGMGAIVTKDVPDGETWVGNPAKKLDKGYSYSDDHETGSVLHDI